MLILDNKIDGLRAESFINSATGKPDVHYIFNDSILKKVELSGALADQISGLSLIQKDLNNAKRWMESAKEMTKDFAPDGTQEHSYNRHAKNRDQFDLVKALFVAALAFYGKAFTTAGGRKVIMRPDWLDEAYRSEHEYYMDFRHNFAAHSGEAQLERAVSYLILIPKEMGRVDIGIVNNRVQPDMIHGVEGHDFVSLIDHAISKVEKRSCDMTEKIMHFAIKKGIVFWVSASESHSPIDTDKLVDGSKKRINKSR